MQMLRSIITAIVVSASLAGALPACATREIPYAALEQKYGFPESRYFEAEPGLAVHYLDEGPRAKPAIVLVHGFAASVHAWRPWVERLKADFRVVSLDLPGHGLTRAPKNYRASLDGNVALVDALASELRIDRFVLGGNSMGGGVAWNYALAHPERLRGLVLVNAAGWPGERARGGDGPPMVFSLMNNPVGRGVLKLFDPRMFATGGLKSAYVDEALVDQALVDRYAEMALAPGHRDVLLTQRSGPATPRTAADFARIATPTLVMQGEKDAIIPPEQQAAIAAAIPGAKLVAYPQGGHVPMEQLPDETARDLRAFLESLPR